MKPKTFLSLLALLLCIQLSAQEELHREYIELYKKIAIQEMERTGIPASIKLAQGLLESSAGTSELASESNNHFGIKCGGDWTGPSYFVKDDDFDNNGNLLHSCFRVYKSPEESYVAHSEFLMNPKKDYRYGFLFKIKRKNYKKWARGLKKSGYATSKSYDKKLIKLIERYKLNKFDKMSIEDVIVEEVKEDKEQGKHEDIAELSVHEDKELAVLDPSEEANAPEIKEVPAVKVSNKKKTNSFRGKKEWHIVKKGETMAAISDRYQIKMSKLLRRNRLKKGQEPAAGEKIKLKGRKVKKTPKLYKAVEVKLEPVVKAEPEPKLEKPTEPIVRKEEPAVVKKEEKLTPLTSDTKETNGRLLDMDMNEAIDLNKVEAPVKINTGTPTTSIDEKLAFEENEIKPTETVDVKLDDVVKETPKEEVVVPEKKQDPQEVYYVVQKGDTLWSIALRHRTTVQDVRELNKLKSSSIRRGMKLRVK